MATAAGRGTKRLREESPESATSWEELLGVRRPQAQESEEALAQTMAATAVPPVQRRWAHLDLRTVGKLLVAPTPTETKSLYLSAVVFPALESDACLAGFGCEIATSLLTAAAASDNPPVRAGLITAYGILLESRTVAAAIAGGMRSASAKANFLRELVALRGKATDYNPNAVAVALRDRVPAAVLAYLTEAPRVESARAPAAPPVSPATAPTYPRTPDSDAYGGRGGGRGGGGRRPGRGRGGRLPPPS